MVNIFCYILDTTRNYLGSFGNWSFYKVKANGSMTSDNVKRTCENANLVNTCVGDSTCKYSTKGCVVTSLTACGIAMGKELSQVICSSDDLRQCPELYDVYAYFPNWKEDGSACGVEKNELRVNYCAKGSHFFNKYALCASKIPYIKYESVTPLRE